jgi:hypothetical protein
MYLAEMPRLYLTAAARLYRRAVCSCKYGPVGSYSLVEAASRSVPLWQLWQESRNGLPARQTEVAEIMVKAPFAAKCETECLMESFNGSCAGASLVHYGAETTGGRR